MVVGDMQGVEHKSVIVGHFKKTCLKHFRIMFFAKLVIIGDFLKTNFYIIVVSR